MLAVFTLSAQRLSATFLNLAQQSFAGPIHWDTFAFVMLALCAVLGAFWTFLRRIRQ